MGYKETHSFDHFLIPKMDSIVYIDTIKFCYN